LSLHALRRLDRTVAPLRLLAFVGLLAAVWLPPYSVMRAIVTDSNTLSILAVALLFIEFVLLLRWWTKRVYRSSNWLSHYGLQPTGRNGRLLLVGLVIGSLSLMTLFAVEASLGWLRWQWPSLAFARIAVEGLLVAIGIGLGEELIFRGWLLQELELAEGRKYYELNTPFMDQHHHLVCVHCGDVQEFEDATMTQVGSSESASRGFSLLNCQFTVYGICPSCQSLLG